MTNVFHLAECKVIRVVCVYIHTPYLFILSSVDENLAGFYILAAVYNRVVNMGVQIKFESLLSILLGIYPEWKLLDHMVILFNFLRNCFTVAASFYIPTNSAWCCSVAKSCPTLWSMNCSTPGFPVLHNLPEFAQTHVHWLSDALQPSHPLLSPSPPAFHLSHHQGLFQWVHEDFSFSTSSPTLITLFFSILAILMGVSCCCNIVLICISLVICDVEYLFMF